MDDFFTPGDDELDVSNDQQTPQGPGTLGAGKTPQAMRNAINFGAFKGQG